MFCTFQTKTVVTFRGNKYFQNFNVYLTLIHSLCNYISFTSVFRRNKIMAFTRTNFVRHKCRFEICNFKNKMTKYAISELINFFSFISSVRGNFDRLQCRYKFTLQFLLLFAEKIVFFTLQGNVYNYFNS